MQKGKEVKADLLKGVQVDAQESIFRQLATEMLKKGDYDGVGKLYVQRRDDLDSSVVFFAKYRERMKLDKNRLLDAYDGSVKAYLQQLKRPDLVDEFDRLGGNPIELDKKYWGILDRDRINYL